MPIYSTFVSPSARSPPAHTLQTRLHECSNTFFRPESTLPPPLGSVHKRLPRSKSIFSLLHAHRTVHVEAWREWQKYQLEQDPRWTARHNKGITACKKPSAATRPKFLSVDSTASSHSPHFARAMRPSACGALSPSSPSKPQGTSFSRVADSIDVGFSRGHSAAAEKCPRACAVGWRRCSHEFYVPSIHTPQAGTPCTCTYIMYLPPSYRQTLR